MSAGGRRMRWPSESGSESAVTRGFTARVNWCVCVCGCVGVSVGARVAVGLVGGGQPSETTGREVEGRETGGYGEPVSRGRAPDYSRLIGREGRLQLDGVTPQPATPLNQPPFPSSPHSTFHL